MMVGTHIDSETYELKVNTRKLQHCVFGIRRESAIKKVDSSGFKVNLRER